MWLIKDDYRHYGSTAYDTTYENERLEVYTIIQYSTGIGIENIHRLTCERCWEQTLQGRHGLIPHRRVPQGGELSQRQAVQTCQRPIEQDKLAGNEERLVPGRRRRRTCNSSDYSHALEAMPVIDKIEFAAQD